MEVRITKYNPKYRDKDGKYLENEWTCISDIGRYPGLTIDQYLDVENSYWEVLISILQSLSIDAIQIKDLEVDQLFNAKLDHHFSEDIIADCRRINFRNNMRINLSDFEVFFRAAMRRIIWGRAFGPNDSFVHFGDDFYLYCGSSRKFSWKETAGIFVEDRKSPYHD